MHFFILKIKQRGVAAIRVSVLAASSTAAVEIGSALMTAPGSLSVVAA